MMIKVNKIIKKFAKKTIINGVSLDIQKGAIFGLLGPNGAGKTTLIRILSGILESNSGSVLLDSKDVEYSKKIFGYVPQAFGQYEELSVWENILFYAQMYGVDDKTRLEYLLKRYNLEQYRDTQAGKLSGGYKRRLALVCALSHNPSVLFLDEPTAGVDPVTRKLLWDDFYALSLEGKTLFITTHYMEEAQRCTQLAFLALGEIVAQGTPKTIIDTLGDVRLFSVNIPYNPLSSEYIMKVKGVVLLNQFGDELRIMVDDKCKIEDIQRVLKEKLKVTLQLKEDIIGIEDAFIALTQDRAL